MKGLTFLDHIAVHECFVNDGSWCCQLTFKDLQGVASMGESHALISCKIYMLSNLSSSAVTPLLLHRYSDGFAADRICWGGAGKKAIVLKWPHLPNDVELRVLESPALDLVDLARLASTSRMFREACIAREANEDAWLSALAAACFKPELTAMAIRWLDLVCTDAIKPTGQDVVRTAEWPTDSVLSSTQHIYVCCPGSSSSSSTSPKISNPEQTCAGFNSVHMFNSLGGSLYFYWMLDSEGHQRGPLRFWITRVPVFNDEVESEGHEHGSAGEGAVTHLKVHVQMRPGRSTAAYLALAHLMCKTLAGLWPGSRDPAAKPTTQGLLIEEPGCADEGWWAHGSRSYCRWSETQLVRCEMAARALAAMHCWHARHSESMPSLSLVLKRSI